MGRFKSKKRFNNTIIYFGLFLISVALSIKYIWSHNLIKENTLIDYLITDSFGPVNKDVIDVDFLMKYVLNVELVKDEQVGKKEEGEKIEIIPPLQEEVKKTIPIVYIYNTHQEEKYKNINLENYNITPNVLLASKILKEYLEDLGIGVIVEEKNVKEKLQSLKWSYGYSYKVSRMFMEEEKNKTPTLKYFIDLHRDSSNYENTTATINNSQYAKLLFVVGLDNQNYLPNLELAEKLKNRVMEFDSSLSRGIMKKSGVGVNGVYNQDFNNNTVLIEVGGQYNNINEVNNTLKILAKILASYIKENENV